MGNKQTSYWEVVEPFWEVVDIYGSPDRFIGTYSEVPRKVGHLFAAHWCQSEVCNGGFHQFFCNSTGVLAPEALEGFRAIGMLKWAALLEKAMSTFGPGYPRDREVRRSLLPPAATGQRREQWDPFCDLDDAFYLDQLPTWEYSADAYADQVDA